MARISGINLPPNKRVAIGLTYLYGIGKSTAAKILASAKVNPDTRVKDLDDQSVNALREIIERSHRVEGDLRREVLMSVKRLREIGAYRGTRHAKHLPVRGQRTRTNSRTVRGNVRKTMGSGRKQSTQKT